MPSTLNEIENAARGLLFMSETEAPLEPVDLGEQDRAAFRPEHLLQALHQPTGTSLEVQEVAYFLRNMTKAREGASPARQAEALRFQALQDLLTQRLSDVRAYRVGQRRVEAYLLGWTPENRLVGLRTLSVET